ncbi:hypothetical protein Tco_0341550 [Tanacetum coccineum]
MTRKLDDIIELPNSQPKRTYNEDLECEIVMVKMPKCMAWLDDEPIGDLCTMEDKVDNPSPQCTPQVLPSIELYTPPVTHPKEVEETIGIPIEVNEARGAKDTLGILFWGVMHKRFGVITSWDFCYDLKSLLSNVEQFKPLRFVPLSPDYVPGPEYPEYLAPSDEEVPMEDQPYAVADSPIALSPGYVADSDPKEDPEEDSKDGPVDYPADGGDGDDDDSSDGDKEEEEASEEEEADEEEEEHLASADSVVALVVDHVPSSEETEPFKTDESAPTPRSR